MGDKEEAQFSNVSIGLQIVVSIVSIDTSGSRNWFVIRRVSPIHLHVMKPIRHIRQNTLEKMEYLVNEVLLYHQCDWMKGRNQSAYRWSVSELLTIYIINHLAHRLPSAILFERVQLPTSTSVPIQNRKDWSEIDHPKGFVQRWIDFRNRGILIEWKYETVYYRFP